MQFPIPGMKAMFFTVSTVTNTIPIQRIRIFWKKQDITVRKKDTGDLYGSAGTWKMFFWGSRQIRNKKEKKRTDSKQKT